MRQLGKVDGLLVGDDDDDVQQQQRTVWLHWLQHYAPARV